MTGEHARPGARALGVRGMRFGGGVWGLVCGLCVVVWVRGSFGACRLCVWVFVFCVFVFVCFVLVVSFVLPSLWLLCVPLFGCVLRFRFCCVFLCGFLCFNGFPFAVLKTRHFGQNQFEATKRRKSDWVSPKGLWETFRGGPVGLSALGRFCALYGFQGVEFAQCTDLYWFSWCF